MRGSVAAENQKSSWFYDFKKEILFDNLGKLAGLLGIALF